MPHEIRLPGLATGATVYAYVQDMAGLWWYPAGAAFEAGDAAHYASYAAAILLEEQPDLGEYWGSFPAAITTPGYYRWVARLQAGGAADASDDTVEDGHLQWDGAAVIVPTDTVFGTGGAVDVTYTVYDADGLTPLPGVSVYVSSDVLGVDRSQTQTTDAEGNVFFLLVPGVVYFWRSLPSRTFDDPDGPFTVS